MITSMNEPVTHTKLIEAKKLKNQVSSSEELVGVPLLWPAACFVGAKQNTPRYQKRQNHDHEQNTQPSNSQHNPRH